MNEFNIIYFKMKKLKAADVANEFYGTEKDFPEYKLQFRTAPIIEKIRNKKDDDFSTRLQNRLTA